MIIKDQMLRISCKKCPLKHISIMDASGMVKTIINDEQIMRHIGQLYQVN